MADSDVTAQSAPADAEPSPTNSDIHDVSTGSPAQPVEVTDVTWAVHDLQFGADGLAEARRFVRRVAGELGASASTAFDVQLAVSELGTNALHHGAAPAQVRVRRSDAGLLVEVSDSGRGVPTQRRSGPSDNNGRGLMIVSSVADEWGTFSTGAGKTVWCRFGL